MQPCLSTEHTSQTKRPLNLYDEFLPAHTANGRFGSLAALQNFTRAGSRPRRPIVDSTRKVGFRPLVGILICTYGAFYLSNCDLGL